MNLIQYIQEHVERSECRCSQCIDAAQQPDLPPTNHTADLVFFKVTAIEANAEELRKLITEFKGDYEVDPLDGREHNYLELGAWIGDQGMAMMLMGLGSILGLWKLLTPYTVIDKDFPEDLALNMAGRGFVIIQATDVTKGC